MPHCKCIDGSLSTTAKLTLVTRHCFCTAWSKSLGARPVWRVECLDVRGPTSSTVGRWILPAIRLYASGQADLKPLFSLSHLFAAARSFRLLLLLLPTGQAAGQLGRQHSEDPEDGLESTLRAGRRAELFAARVLRLSMSTSSS